MVMICRAALGWRAEPCAAAFAVYAEQRRAYSTPGYSASVQRVERYAGLHRGQRCVIIDSDANWGGMDLSLLGQQVTFGVDQVCFGAGEHGFPITYYVSVSPVVLEQSGQAIADLLCPKFVSVAGHPHVKAGEDLMFLGWKPYWDFSEDASKGVCQDQSSVYAAMQIASYMGFAEVVFIGGDRREHKELRGGPYVAPGEPRRDTSEIAFRMAQVCFERNGRRVLDATPNGTLKVFPKVDYAQHLSLPYVAAERDAT